MQHHRIRRRRNQVRQNVAGDPRPRSLGVSRCLQHAGSARGMQEQDRIVGRHLDVWFVRGGILGGVEQVDAAAGCRCAESDHDQAVDKAA